MTRDLYGYFEDELAYLRELGAEFASAHPAAASHLDVRGGDPSVERLLQGVAFLNARLHKRLDDDFPELSQLVLRWLWPEMLRPVPATAIQRFAHPQSRPLRVERGARVRSQELQPDVHARQKVQVVFETTMDVDILPLRVEGLRVVPGGRHGALEVGFRCEGTTVAELLAGGLDALTLHLADADEGFASLLVQHLVMSDEAPTARVGARSATLAPIEAVGFEEEERLLLGWPAEAKGRRLLHEYFVQPAKYRFVRVAGLSRLEAPEGADELRIHVPLVSPFRDAGRLRPEQVQLGCTPVVNRFKASAKPITRPPHHDLFPIVTRAAPAGCFEVLEVGKVTGSVRTADGRTHGRTYLPRARVLAGLADEQPWFDVRRKKGPVDKQVHAFLMLSTADTLDERERISLELHCSNGRIASSLARGDLRHPVSGVPSGTDTENLTVPTPAVSPDVGADSVWHMVGLLHTAGSPLSDVHALRSLLGLHDPRGRDDDRGRARRRTRLEAVAAVSVEPQDRLVPVKLLDPASGASRLARAPCRGVGLRLDVDMAALGGPGQAWLFGSVLERFLAEHVTLNAFCQLGIHDVGARFQELAWPPRLGRRTLI